MTKWRLDKKQQLINDHKKSLYKRHKEILKKALVYKKPNLINYELIDNLDNAYVLPIFIRPGRTHFFVRDVFNVNFASDLYHRRLENMKGKPPKDSGYRYYYSRHIISIREETIPKLSKKMKRTFVKTKF